MRHAWLAAQLGMAWEYEPATVHGLVDEMGRRCSYTPDFYLPDTEQYIEIKPQAPYDLEVRKAVGFCAHTRRDLVLLFNTDFRPPFAVRAETAGRQGSYAHARGVKGMRFRWDAAAGKVGVEHDVAYMAEDGRGGGGVPGATAVLDVRRGTADLRPPPKVLAAYETVARDLPGARPSEFRVVVGALGEGEVRGGNQKQGQAEAASQCACRDAGLRAHAPPLPPPSSRHGSPVAVQAR